ncbi:putative peptidylprolyl isomerase [Helianthus annuus]|nr:putative peptidylprolyl isomerase [Helianthus annuus]
MSKKNPLVYLDVSIDGDPIERMIFELFSGTVPKTAREFSGTLYWRKGEWSENWKTLHYKGSFFHHIIKGSLAQQPRLGIPERSVIRKAGSIYLHKHGEVDGSKVRVQVDIEEKTCDATNSWGLCNACLSPLMWGLTTKNYCLMSFILVSHKRGPLERYIKTTRTKLGSWKLSRFSIILIMPILFYHLCRNIMTYLKSYVCSQAKLWSKSVYAVSLKT